MSDQNMIERLDEAIDAMFRGRREGLAFADPELATLLVLAADLRDLPSPDFKQQLKEKIMGRPTTAAVPPREGFHTITPYLIVNGASEMISFLETAFGAEEKLRVHSAGRIQHAEVLVGDSMIEIADANEEWKPIGSALHVYVEDADNFYERALAAGATSISAPVDQPYGDREAGVVDRFGNEWWIATHMKPGPGPAPEGFRTVTPGMRVPGAAQMLDFLVAAFGAEVISRSESPQGAIMHADVRIGDSIIELGEPHGPWQTKTAFIHLFVDDTDAVHDRAVRMGAESVMPPKDTPYGQRGALVRDAAGNHWYIAQVI